MAEREKAQRPESLDDGTLVQPLDPRRPSLPESIGRFQIVRLMARGSSTEIYQVATPGAGNQRLVLKLLSIQDESIDRWFERAASVAASLNHPHILPCLEAGRVDGRPYMLMPFVDGETVAELGMFRRPTDFAEVVRITRSIAAALDHAHKCGIVHGDVHPKHVLLSRAGHVWVTGFAEVGAGYPEIILGNPHHLAPEQFAGLDNTVPQSDVYSLGEIAFLLLTGSYPFHRDVGLKLFDRKRSGPVPSIREHRQDLARSVDRTLQRAIAIRPEDRFPSCGQLVEALAAALRLSYGQA